MRTTHDLRSVVSTSGPRPRIARISLAIFTCGSIGVGTMLAMSNVPDDVSDATALFMPALYLSIALLLPVVIQVRSDLTAVLRIENALTLGIIYWLLLDMLQSAYPLEFVSSENVQSAFGMVGAFAGALWIGASSNGWPLPRIVASTATREFTIKALFSATLIAFILGMAKFVVGSGFDPTTLIRGLGASRWDTPWTRGDFGGADAFLDHMQYFGYIMPSLCVLMAMKVGWLNGRVLTGLLLSAIVVAFLAQSGGRRIIGVVIGAALYTWLAAKPRLEPRVIFGGAATVVLLLTFMQEMLRYRGVGFAALVANESPGMGVEYLHVDDNFLRLAQLIKFYPDTMDFVLHQPLFHALTLPIPRVFWPGKPLGPGFDLPGLLGRQGFSLSCSIIGELYVSFGIWAVLGGGWILGRIAGMWNKILLMPTGTSRPLMYGLGLMALFAGMRSVQALVQMSYIVLAWIAVTSLLPQSRFWGKRGDGRRSDLKRFDVPHSH